MWICLVLMILPCCLIKWGVRKQGLTGSDQSIFATGLSNRNSQDQFFRRFELVTESRPGSLALGRGTEGTAAGRRQIIPS